MKKILRISLGSLILTGILFSSCSTKLDNAYLNPNQPAIEPIENIFPSIIGSIIGSSAASGSAYGIAGDGILIGRYLQYWNNYTVTTSQNGGTQYDEMGGTIASSDNFGSMWGAFYFGMGQNLNRVVEWGSTQQKWDYVGGARALRAWGWLELGDEYADAIIIKEAFNTSLQTFDYDSLQLAYDSCRRACYDALSFLNRTDGNVSASNFAIGDAYFLGGDINKWKKFVYGILARSYANLTNKSNYQPDSVIYYANLAMTTNADNTACKFQGTALSGTNNYFGSLRGNVGSLRQSAYITDLMSGRNATAFTGVEDPRRWYMLREDSGNTFHGVVAGVDPKTTLTSKELPQNFWGNPFSSTSAPTTPQGRYIFRDTAQFPIMTASEMQFLIAEAAFRKGDKATALTAYKNAISLDIDMLTSQFSTNVPSDKTITAGIKSAFLSNPEIVPTSANDLTLTDIMLQKYISLFGWGFQQTWTDMRRFHYTDIDPQTGKQVYAGFIPGGGSLYPDNGGKSVYRARPRYNSEYLYDVPSLKLVGALDASGSQVPDYHTKETWFSQK